MEKCGDDIINWLICIFILTVQEMFREEFRSISIIIFLIFNQIFIKFSLFCLNIVILSIELI